MKSAEYFKKIYHTLKWLHPSELPGVGSINHDIERCSLFFPINLSDGVIEFQKNRSLWSFQDDTFWKHQYPGASKEQILKSFLAGDNDKTIKSKNITNHSISRNGENQFRFIVSLAGGGKSSFLKMILLSYAAYYTQNDDIAIVTQDGIKHNFLTYYKLPCPAKNHLIVPILIECKKWTPNTEMEAFIIENGIHRFLPSATLNDFGNCELLLLFDSLDEISDDYRNEFFKLLAAYCGNEEHEKKTFVVVTSRPTWFPAEEQIENLSICFESILPLTVEQIIGTQENQDCFALQYYHALYPMENDKDFRHNLILLQKKKYAYLHDVIDTPLMALTILKEVSAGKNISTNKSELFYSFFDSLFRWKTDYNRCDRIKEDRMTVMGFIAYLIMVNPSKLLSLPKESCIAAWEECNNSFTMLDNNGPKTRSEIENELLNISASLSVLSLSETKDHSFFSFSHRQYLEFFCAYAIVKGFLPSEAKQKSLIELLEPHYQDTRWEEIILYTLFLLHKNKAQHEKEWLLIQDLHNKGFHSGSILLLLLRNRFPLSPEQKKYLFPRFFFDFSPSSVFGINKFFSKFLGVEKLNLRYLAELANEVWSFGGEYRKIAAVIKLYICEQTKKDLLSEVLQKDIKSPEAMAIIWSASFLRYNELLLFEFPILISHRPLKKDVLSLFLNSIQQNEISVEFLSVLRLGRLICDDDYEYVFSQEMFDLSIQHLLLNWKSQTIDESFFVFSGWPVKNFSLSLKCNSFSEDFLNRLYNALIISRQQNNIWYLSGVILAMLTKSIRFLPFIIEWGYINPFDTNNSFGQGQNRVVIKDINELYSGWDQDSLTRIFNVSDQDLINSISALKEMIRSNGPGRSNIPDCNGLVYLMRNNPTVNKMCSIVYPIDQLLAQGLKVYDPVSIMNWLLYQFSESPKDPEEFNRIFARLYNNKDAWIDIFDWWNHWWRNKNKSDNVLYEKNLISYFAKKAKSPIVCGTFSASTEKLFDLIFASKGLSLSVEL